jgi:hypothetical protein
MTELLSHWSSKAIDSYWWQLPLVTLASLLVWSVLLLAFGLYLAHMHPAAPPVDAIQASIIEVSGLAGGGGGSPGVGHSGSAPRQLFLPVATIIFAGWSPGLIDRVGSPSGYFGLKLLP